MKKNDQHQKYKELRKQYTYFCYQSFNYAVEKGFLKIKYHFHLSDQYHFYPTHELPVSSDFRLDAISKPQIDNLVFHFGMVELISYWKAACPPQLLIKPFALNNKQISWWKKLYFQGLGEFFYLNEIENNEEDFIEIISDNQNKLEVFHTTLSEKIMVPIGGGKDSVVSLETLKELDKKLIPFVVNPRGATTESIENAGFSLKDAYFTKRSIHPQLLELNKEGFLNGHTPFSAMLAFLSLIAARLNNAKHIALSNESSANESTVEGTQINHQYSKSFEFEKDFRNYYQEYISPDFEYFSFLRPLSELQIASLFSQLPQHYFSFKSCNVGSKKNIWCGNCPKCLFTYILMSPFIPTDKLHQIFGKALLNDTSLKPIFNELRGKTASKPFECVGTIDEVEWSLQHVKKDIYEESLLKESDVIFADQEDNNTLKAWNKQHFLAKEFEEVLKAKLSL